MVEPRNRCQKIPCSHRGFCTVLWSQGNCLILFSSLVCLSKYLNYIGFLGGAMLEPGNFYKGFEKTNRAKLKRCELLFAVGYVL